MSEKLHRAGECIDCRWSQAMRWERLCMRWMPPRKVAPGQEACGEFRAKTNTWKPQEMTP